MLSVAGAKLYFCPGCSREYRSIFLAAPVESATIVYDLTQDLHTGTKAFVCRHVRCIEFILYSVRYRLLPCHLLADETVGLELKLQNRSGVHPPYWHQCWWCCLVHDPNKWARIIFKCHLVPWTCTQTKYRRRSSSKYRPNRQPGSRLESLQIRLLRFCEVRKLFTGI